MQPRMVSLSGAYRQSMSGVPFTDGENTAAPLVPTLPGSHDDATDGTSEEMQRYLEGAVRHSENVSY